MTQEDKQRATDLLRERITGHEEELQDIDNRLYDYIRGLADNPNVHNAYEILGAIRFLRLLDTYVKDVDTFRLIVYKYEGLWQQEYEGGPWHHVRDGIRQPGTSGATYYRLQPFQIFVLASMFLLRAWISTELPEGSRALLPTEKIVKQ